MSTRRPPVLLGRAVERRALDEILEHVRGGRSTALVIRGEAGIGKTALLQYCARQAAGFRVVRTAFRGGRRQAPAVLDRRRTLARRRVRPGPWVRGAAVEEVSVRSAGASRL